MKSQIDWNEVVLKLSPGLQQTLYLEAVKIISEESRAELRKRSGRGPNGAYLSTPAQRDYARDYMRRRRANGARLTNRKVGKPRHWTDEKKAEVLALYKKEGYSAVMDKYKISSSMLSRWHRRAKKG